MLINSLDVHVHVCKCVMTLIGSMLIIDYSIAIAVVVLQPNVYVKGLGFIDLIERNQLQ